MRPKKLSAVMRMGNPPAFPYYADLVIRDGDRYSSADSKFCRRRELSAVVADLQEFGHGVLQRCPDSKCEIMVFKLQKRLKIE